MFGSLGIPELLLIFAVVLIVFGPRKIPEIGRLLGKAMGEFRKATDDLKNTIEREVRLEELKKITPPTLDSFMTPEESVSRSEPVSLYETGTAQPEAVAALPEAPAVPDPATAAGPVTTADEAPRS
jgi:TatA/E family protein of Tat protein translocase